MVYEFLPTLILLTLPFIAVIGVASLAASFGLGLIGVRDETMLLGVRLLAAILAAWLLWGRLTDILVHLVARALS